MQDDNIVGRYYGQCPDIDGQVILQGNSRVFPGERYWVELTGFDDYDLIGKVVEGPK
jgi:ribosomal protein S12 methylthiotransferase